MAKGEKRSRVAEPTAATPHAARLGHSLFEVNEKIDSCLQGLPSRIRYAARQVGGISALAERLEVSGPTISGWIRPGAKPPSATRLLQIALCCSVDVGWLLTGDPDTHPRSVEPFDLDPEAALRASGDLLRIVEALKNSDLETLKLVGHALKRRNEGE